MRVAARPFDGRLNGSLILKGPRPSIDPTAAPYNADPTGVVDSTAAIQAALDAAIQVGVNNNRGCDVNLATGTYKISDTLTIPHSSYQYGSVGLVGHSPWTTALNYVGPTDGRAAIFVDKQFMYHLGNFAIHRSGAIGTSVGILFGSATGSGTQTISGVILPLSVQNFYRGIQLGDEVGPVAISEHTFQWLQLGGCTYGVYATSYNTLNIVFQFISAAGCGYVVYTASAGNIFIEAGAGADNTLADFYFGPANGRNEIRNWRTERPKRVLIVESGGTIIDNVLVQTYPGGHDGVAIECLAAATLDLRNTDLFDGQITGVNNGTVRATLTHSSVGGPYYVNLPPAGSGTLRHMQVVAAQSYVGGVSTGPLAVYVGGDDGEMHERFRVGSTDAVGTSGHVALNGVAAPASPQPSVGAAATDPATTMALVNALRTVLVARGDVAT